jgi:uncharacterized phage protein (TIGR02216 family)
MGFGLGRLRLSPDQFWQMTPVELAAAARALMPAFVQALGKAALADLIQRFPD